MANRDPANSGNRLPDPVSERAFMLDIGGKPLGLFSECTGLAVEYDVQTHEEGGQNLYVHKLRGRAKNPNLVLKRGVTHQKDLLEWFTSCSAKIDFREVKLQLLSPAGKGGVVRTFALHRVYPIKWTGPNFNASSSSIATETLELAYHGFEDA